MERSAQQTLRQLQDSTACRAMQCSLRLQEHLQGEGLQEPCSSSQQHTTLLLSTCPRSTWSNAVPRQWALLSLPVPVLVR